MGAGSGPAERMEGVALTGGWRVGAKVGPGGSRSVGYEVTGPNGEEAFLKALDIFSAYDTDDSLAAMDEIVSSIRHERDLVDLCSGHRMSRVVRGLAQGQVKLADGEHAVFYMIFERAEGDVRHQLADIGPQESSWRLSVLHEAAVGLQQMHSHGLCHQNVKPAHLLAFGAQGVKLADLSTTSMQGASAPLFDAKAPGDRAYAPPECLYDFEVAEGIEAHRARDMYLYGSLMLFVYVEVTTTTALLLHLPRSWHPGRVGLSFQEALPHLEEAFDRVVEEELVESAMPRGLIQSFRELCAPDPRQRGHPRTRAQRHSSPYSLERYVSRIALELARANRGDGQGRRAA